MYGLSGASRYLYLTIKELIKIGAKCSKYDPALFYCHHNQQLHGTTCTHVDDFLFGGKVEFMPNVIKFAKEKFVIGIRMPYSFHVYWP